MKCPLASAPQASRFFFGPKDLDALAAIKPDPDARIDFGMFAWLVVPLLQALKWVNGYVGNYGWSIIVLTILINIDVPAQAQERGLDAQDAGASAADEGDPGSLREAEGDRSRRQKMNEEVMALYRARHESGQRVRPMLLTLPVLFAFYAMLSVAIELRGAPFVGWIKDLSAHDPYYVTPVLMGVTSSWQSEMTPTSADPVQQRR